MAKSSVWRLAWLGLAMSTANAAAVVTYGDWRDDAPGVQHLIRPTDLPPPFSTRSAGAPPRIVAPPEGALPKVPEGFAVTRALSGLRGPRVLRAAPNGDVFVAESEANRVRVLRFAPDMSGIVENHVFADHLESPFGIAFFPARDPRYVYIATTTAVFRYPYRAGALSPEGKAETVVSGLPAGGHWTRDLAISQDGATLFVSVGSQSNDAERERPLAGEALAQFERIQARGASAGDEEGRADVLAFDLDGGHRRVVATGLRNCSGLGIQPAADRLWCVVNERDGLGDDLPPDYATPVKAGAFYGWPWYYIGAHPDPRHRDERPDLAGGVETPAVLFQPHSAPLGIAFYEGSSFPADYRGDAFVAMHGSWNRAKRTGYKVVRLRLKEGEPTGAYEDFLTGFVADDQNVWGRPVGVAVAADGSLLVSDDAGGVIWRVAHTPK